MKMSLFSSFNPITTKTTSALWASMYLTTLIMPNKMWKQETKTLTAKKMMTSLMNNQFKTMMKKSMKINAITILSMMMVIMTLNLSSLFPFSFAHTSQPQTTMGLAMPLWLGIMMMKMKTPQKLMAHMVPPSTPTPLMPLMVLIETMSNCIQPITLSIRLMANITAGHILMTLIATSHPKSWASMFTLMAQMALTLMEMFVSMIQAYVFSMLMTMYMK